MHHIATKSPMAKQYPLARSLLSLCVAIDIEDGQLSSQPVRIEIRIFKMRPILDYSQHLSFSSYQYIQIPASSSSRRLPVNSEDFETQAYMGGLPIRIRIDLISSIASALLSSYLLLASCAANPLSSASQL